ncbi:hypothetical protein [Paracoccus cavernae]
MRLRLPLVLSAAALALSGCVVQNPNALPPLPPATATPVAPVVPGAAAQSSARLAINREMARRLPGANVAPYTDCVVNNATGAEMADIGRLSAAGSNISDAVAAVVARPATTQCIAGAASAARATA